MPVIVALLFLFKDHRSFLMVGLSAGLSALVVQLIKFAVEQPRPSMYLELMPGLRLVDGVELLRTHSFPSGHATAAFSTCLALAVITARPVPVVLFALLAAAIAFSRVYLSQHFTEDVVAGATIGTFTAVVVHRWLYVSSFAERPWLERSFLRGPRG
jgi:membrane-associated phospholipid phosphatase